MAFLVCAFPIIFQRGGGMANELIVNADLVTCVYLPLTPKKSLPGGGGGDGCAQDMSWSH